MSPKDDFDRESARRFDDPSPRSYEVMPVGRREAVKRASEAALPPVDDGTWKMDPDKDPHGHEFLHLGDLCTLCLSEKILDDQRRAREEAWAEGALWCANETTPAEREFLTKDIPANPYRKA